MKVPRIKYEPEDDVLNIWLAEKRVDDVDDIDGVIIHYTKDREPVYIEILDASRFLGKGYKSFYKRISQSQEISVAVPHRIRK